MSDTRNAVLDHLSVLLGAELSACSRAADMLTLQFGPLSMLPARSGKVRQVGRWSLHVQCAWRIELNSMLYTGRSDLWEPEHCPDAGFDWSAWNFEDGNLRDSRLASLFGDRRHDESLPDEASPPVVETVDADDFGGARLSLSKGYHLVLFPDGTRSEDWRLLSRDAMSSHFIICGGRWESGST